MTTYGMLWTSLCQYPELLGQNDVEYSRFVCNYSSPGYQIYILTTPAKHIDIRYHFVREAITTDKVTLEHCATDDMVADPMTKELSKTKHDRHVEAIGLR